MLDLVPATLPKNVNGFRTTHTCELCGFEPKTKNKYREKQDHLVMKHFKEKIDKIFPHSRPYACPTEECGFQGKDKQALLRHYTGKHGILEKYLKEALAEKGISYVPGDHGSKRKHSTDSNGSSKAKKMMITANGTTILDPKDMLPKSPVPPQLAAIAQNGNGNHVTINSRPNNEELRKEVEAMMASFQPQPQQEAVAVTNGSSTIKVLPSLPTQPVPVSIEVNGTSGEKKTVILSNRVPPLTQIPTTQPHQQTTILTSQSNGTSVPHQAPASVVSLVKRNEVGDPQPQAVMNGKPTIILANGQKLQLATAAGVNSTNGGGQIHIPELILPQEAHANGGHHIVSSNTIHAIPIEVITTVAPSNGGLTNGGVVSINGETCIVENEEVMWGAGPAVVVESNDNTVPIQYIEGSEIVYSANIDNIDYDYLYPVTTTTASTEVTNGVPRPRERQLEFSML